MALIMEDPIAVLIPTQKTRLQTCLFLSLMFVSQAGMVGVVQEKASTIVHPNLHPN